MHYLFNLFFFAMFDICIIFDDFLEERTGTVEHMYSIVSDFLNQSDFLIFLFETYLFVIELIVNLTNLILALMGQPIFYVFNFVVQLL